MYNMRYNQLEQEILDLREDYKEEANIAILVNRIIIDMYVLNNNWLINIFNLSLFMIRLN